MRLFHQPLFFHLGRFDAYVLVFIHYGTRKVWMSPATFSPANEWCRQQAINASMWIEEEGFNFRHLIRDNDQRYSDRFDEIFRSISIAREPIVRTGIRMPLMNSIVESYIGHFQAECLNYFLCFSLGQLDRICARYGRYCNEQRPHQSLVIGNRVLDKNWQPPPPIGTVKRQKILGGLLNHYYRDAG